MSARGKVELPYAAAVLAAEDLVYPERTGIHVLARAADEGVVMSEEIVFHREA